MDGIDQLVETEVGRMFRDVLEEMEDPSWDLPKGMVIEGEAPKEAIALCIVQMRLHKREHNN